MLPLLALLAGLIGIGVVNSQVFGIRVAADSVHASLAAPHASLAALVSVASMPQSPGIHLQRSAFRRGRATSHISAVVARSDFRPMFHLQALTPRICNCRECFDGTETISMLASHFESLLSSNTCAIPNPLIISQATLYNGNLEVTSLRSSSLDSLRPNSLIAGGRLQVEELFISGTGFLIAGGDIEIARITGGIDAEAILISRTGTIKLSDISPQVQVRAIAHGTTTPSQIAVQYLDEPALPTSLALLLGFQSNG